MSTDEKPGILIDGIPHSAEWREKQLAAERVKDPSEPPASTAVPVAEFASAEKDFVSSVMIPVDMLAGETRSGPASTEAPDPYIEGLLGGSRDQPRSPQPDEDDKTSSTREGELDRWFQEQATSLPQAAAAQTLPPGSASLESATDPGVRVERARRARALRARVSRTRASHSQSRAPVRGRAGSGWARVTRMRAGAVAAVIVVPVVGIAIAITGGSPAHRPRVNPPSPSASRSLAGLLDASLSMAGRIPSIERISVRAGRPRPRRRYRAPRRHGITQPAASSGSASGSSYTARFASQTGGSPAARPSPPASASSGGGGSSASSGSPPSRTGPTGPISLIGAGTTPSG